MKTKNTRELRLRANSHARAGHVMQGTYGKGKLNGLPGYRGCAIACLAAPHRKRDLLKMLRGLIGHKRTGMWHEGPFTSGRWRKALKSEFGLCDGLIRVVEGYFEAQPTHAQAIDFVRDFAHALPEGTDIQDRHVRAFMRRQGYTGGLAEYTQIETFVKSDGRGLSTAWSRKRLAEERTAELLAWLRSRAPKPVAAS